MAQEKFCFKWKRNDAVDTSATAQHHLYEVDVTLLCEGKFIKAHKMVLAGNSTFFRELFAAHPESDIVALPEDVNLADLMTLIESMYFGEVTLRKHQLFALIKAAHVLKVHGRCMFTLDKGTNEVPAISRDRAPSFVVSEGPQLPQSLPAHETRASEGHAFIDMPSAFASGLVQSCATDKVQDSSLQLATISPLQEPSTSMYAASIEQINACSSKDCMSESAVEATKNLVDSKQQLFPGTAFPSPSTSMEASDTSSPSMNAMPSDSLDSLSSGSKLPTGSYEVPESMKFVKFVEDAEVGHPLTGVDVGGASTIASDMPDAGGDATQQASGAGAQPSAPGPDLAPLPLDSEGSSSGVNLLRPIKVANRKRAASASNTQATSLKVRTEESLWNGPITRSRAARLAKQ
ncbi:hypothetical protein MRX96_008648 [Rhipicephalus microplus]|uniref:uncharacterized protein LOC142768777 n=1 Tax=Rhipicephalus microplus TaxID=6941 RepID=UPI003F6A95B7